MKDTDTIAALATVNGRAGVAMVRVSGPQVQSIIANVLKKILIPRQASYLSFYDKNDDVLDQGMAIFFPQPHSFTGEDVLELHGHGSPVVVDLLLKRLLQLGVRMANPGEFTERAFLNNKIDLAQAEAIADLIDASSQQAARSALRSLQGEFSKAIHALNDEIIHLRMYMETSIDFVDEDIDFFSHEKMLGSLKKILQSLKSIQNKSQQGSLLREGITVVIAGQPNVGKSSLLNRLSGKDIAIVTDIPGTTRDVLRDQVLIDGIPVHVIDTAGLRESNDRVELIGIKRAYDELKKADIILYVVDACAEKMDQLALPPTLAHLTQPIIFVRNKIDLIGERPSVTRNDKLNQIIVSLSVKNNWGLDLFTQQIKSKVGYDSVNEDVYLARRRHLDALARAYVYLENGLCQLKKSCLELAAEDLRHAHLALCEMTGAFTSDDLLGKIFASFCVGK